MYTKKKKKKSLSVNWKDTGNINGKVDTCTHCFLKQGPKTYMNIMYMSEKFLIFVFCFFTQPDTIPALSTVTINQRWGIA